jgi:ligand-binding sensor domain-containing protein
MKSSVFSTALLSVLVLLGGCGRVGHTDFEPTFSVPPPDPGYWQATNVQQGNDFRSLIRDGNRTLFGASSKNGVYISTDNGDRWIPSNSGLETQSVYVVAALYGGEILAGSDGDGVYRSTDNGASWIRVGLDNTSLRAFLVSNEYVLAGTSAHGMFRADRRGDGWKHIENSPPDRAIQALAMSGTFMLFAGTNRGVYRSNDAGVTWALFGLDDVSIRCLWVDIDGNIYAATSRGIFISFDAGDTWLSRSAGLPNTNVLSGALNSNAELFVGTKEGVFRSADRGVTWVSMNDGLPNRYARSLLMNSDGYLFVGTNGGGIFRSIQSTVRKGN